MRVALQDVTLFVDVSGPALVPDGAPRIVPPDRWAANGGQEDVGWRAPGAASAI